MTNAGGICRPVATLETLGNKAAGSSLAGGFQGSDSQYRHVSAHGSSWVVFKVTTFLFLH